MKLGYIHSNREEQTRVMQVLKMTSESVALDELGIGRIRDAFSDRMFPGISTRSTLNISRSCLNSTARLLKNDITGFQR